MTYGTQFASQNEPFGPPPGGGGWGVGARTSTIAGTAILFFLAAVPALAQKTGLPSKFFLGADPSALDAPTRWPLPPYQEDGKPSDETTILMHHGWTAFRVRVFVSPVRNAPDNTLENAIPLARKIKSAGAILILDLHFSDTWADPQHQDIPVAWREMNFDELAKQWEKYAHDTVRAAPGSRLRAIQSAGSV
ncbi:MAG: glycosyl hydrolase 53 family protein [Acidobacteriaceae bacterium]